MSKIFNTKVVGVKHKNPDGTKRQAATLYRDQQPHFWKFPINRMSLVLERNKRYKECLKIIEQYENI